MTLESLMAVGFSRSGRFVFGESMESEIQPLPVVRIAHIRPAPRQKNWLVTGLWAECGVGVIGGIPKACKTWLALELAVAVASGQPCLGRYHVEKPGPVLLYAAEDTAEALRERVVGLAHARGVYELDRLAVGLITEPALRLDVPGHRARLEATLATIQPRLLVLDPLVRLHRADENSSADVSEILGFLRGLQREFNVAIALVHHVRKTGAGQPGQALRGSGDLHAWGDSNLYLLHRKGKLLLHVEHRAHPSPPPVSVALVPDPARLEVGEPVEEQEIEDLDRTILDVLSSEQPITRTALRERLHVRNERLGEALNRLVAGGRISRTEEGWTVPRSHP